MFRYPLFSILLIFSLVSIKSIALEVNDLYQVTIVVDSQTLAQRELAITKALQGVFLKIGGKTNVLKHKVLLQAQKKSSTFVNQYRYQREDDELSIVVNFNENKVNAVFKQADLPLWGSLRPQVLLWLIDEQENTRTIVAHDADTTIPESINTFSTQRGLPIVMPLMDLTDSEQVVMSDFWGYFPEKIEQASSRYFADTVIVMRVSDSSLVINAENKDNDNSQSIPITVDDFSCGLLCDQQRIDTPKDLDTPKNLDWKVYTQGALYTQQYEGVDKEGLITQGLSDITELIYQSYALSTTDEHDFVIEVNNITSLKSDTQAFDFLTDLSAVKEVTLISAQGDVRRFKLDLIGSKKSFLASLKLNNKLTLQIEPLLENSLKSGLEPNLGSSFDSVALAPKGDVLDEVFDDTLDALKPDNYQEMNVIVLGNAEPNINDFIINGKKVSRITFNGTIINNVEDNTDQSNQNITDENTINITETDFNSVAGTEEEPILLVEDIVPLTITPNIPVFYWEEG